MDLGQDLIQRDAISECSPVDDVDHVGQRIGDRCQVADAGRLDILVELLLKERDPVSSASSRANALRGSSPCSRPPPGNVHEPTWCPRAEIRVSNTASERCIKA
jgi:hypothetical protein